MTLVIEHRFIPPETAAGIIADFDGLVAADGGFDVSRRIELRTTLFPAYMLDIRARALELFHARVRPTAHIDFSIVVAMPQGDSHTLHADAEHLAGGPNHTAWRHGVAMLYLNQHGADFEGGELILPKLGVQVCPRPGLAVLFPSTLEYQHKVPQIARGRRMAIAMWFTDDARWREPPSHDWLTHPHAEAQCTDKP